MELLAPRPQLEHAAQHRHLGPAGLEVHQQVQGGAHALRVRVVTIDDQRESSDAPDLPAHVTCFDPADAGGGLSGRDVQQLGDRQREERVLDRVASRNPELHGLSTPDEAPAPLFVHRRIVRAILGVRAGPEAHDQNVTGDARGVFREDGRLLAHDRRSVVRKSTQEVELFRKHTLEGLQLLDVGLGDGRHDTDLGLSDPGQLSDLPWLVRTHFEHDDLGVIGCVEQRQWQTDTVVQVAGCGVDPARTLDGRPGQLLGPGLSR